MKWFQMPKGTFLYVALDFLGAVISWFCFVLYRKVILEGVTDWNWISDTRMLSSLLIVPLVWMLINIVFDSYKSIYRMSRMTEFARTFATSLAGSLFLFFTLLLDDLANYYHDYSSYYLAFVGVFIFHFGIIAFIRLNFLSWASRQIKTGKVAFNTIVIGRNPKGLEIYKDIISRKKSIGYRFIGYVDTRKSNDAVPHPFEGVLPLLGHMNELNLIIEEQQVEEVILSFKKSDNTMLRKALGVLGRFQQKLLIRVIPDMYDLLLGKVKMANVYGAVLIEIKTHFIPMWVRFTKRVIDLSVSVLVLVLLSPLYAFVALKVRLSSKGPIIYSQQRVGRYGQLFWIYKFRSMYTDAEKSGPQLSSDTDDRCTAWGRIMRKYRLDEIPQFWNVLKGDMSLVGPRPERQHYIDLIAKQAPHVHMLHRVRPGITSWGQVKYGYASNVEEMIQRLALDILYIENLSLGLDFKIMVYTVLVIVQGRGK